MAQPPSFGHITVALTTGRHTSQDQPASDEPFRILILGDFSGRAPTGDMKSKAQMATRRPIPIDRDNFDEVFAGMGVKITLPLEQTNISPLTLPFNKLDDFHPDHIVQQIQVFQVLKNLRKQLMDPTTFQKAANEIQTWAMKKSKEHPKDPKQKRQEPSPPEPEPVDTDQLLKQILEGSESPQQSGREGIQGTDWKKFLQTIMAPHIVPGTDPEQPKLLAYVDEAISEQMHQILHDPGFQQIEASWRGLFLLMQRLETDAQLTVSILDISKDELTADLGESEDLGSTAIYHHLVETTVGTQGGEPWAVVAAQYTFDRTREDATLLGRIANIAAQGGFAFLAEASSNVLGCPSLAQNPDPRDWSPPDTSGTDDPWEALRQLAEAKYLGLALPRFILRWPYGKQTDPLEIFDFEEMSDPPKHQEYLWGNPIFACLYLLGTSFNQDEWNLRPGTFQEIDGLPLHVVKEGGETKIQPCAETILTERAAEAILDQGLMPLVSIKNQDAIRLVRFQSLAKPYQPLAGRWG